MIHHRPIVKGIIFSLFFLTFFSLGFTASAQDGKTLFQNNCATCHNPIKDGTGPALKGVTERVGDVKLLHAWIKNNTAVLASGNPYFTKLFNERGKTAMPTFTQFSEADIDAIVKYVETYAPPAAPGGGGSNTPAAQDSDNSLLYGILTLILAVITLILLQVNSNLKKLSDDKEGVPAHEPVPFYRNKAYIATLSVVLFIIAGYYISQGAIGLGRNKDYQPEQPIYYSHKVHAGTNQISCLYCHGGAFEGKSANIPAVNMCMNCHMSINEYTGEKLYREDGSEVNGTAEIQKIYAASGWDPKTKKYATAGKPVEWTKIHNLPDHVFFSHAQHTRAGKVQCQTCHGPIQEMNEVKQFADLSMGWCINCHRESKVQFFNPETNEGNKFYSIYEKFHNDVKNHRVDSVTVEMIGGTECQKCHY